MVHALENSLDNYQRENMLASLEWMLEHCWKNKNCEYYEKTNISELCNNPKCKHVGLGELGNEINRAIITKCSKEKLYKEAQEGENGK